MRKLVSSCLQLEYAAAALSWIPLLGGPASDWLNSLVEHVIHFRVKRRRSGKHTNIFSNRIPPAGLLLLLLRSLLLSSLPECLRARRADRLDVGTPATLVLVATTVFQARCVRGQPTCPPFLAQRNGYNSWRGLCFYPGSYSSCSGPAAVSVTNWKKSTAATRENSFYAWLKVLTHSPPELTLNSVDKSGFHPNLV